MLRKLFEIRFIGLTKVYISCDVQIICKMNHIEKSTKIDLKKIKQFACQYYTSPIPNFVKILSVTSEVKYDLHIMGSCMCFM